MFLRDVQATRKISRVSIVHHMSNVKRTEERERAIRESVDQFKIPPVLIYNPTEIEYEIQLPE